MKGGHDGFTVDAARPGMSGLLCRTIFRELDPASSDLQLTVSAASWGTHAHSACLLHSFSGSLHSSSPARTLQAPQPGQTHLRTAGCPAHPLVACPNRPAGTRTGHQVGWAHSDPRSAEISTAITSVQADTLRILSILNRARVARHERAPQQPLPWSHMDLRHPWSCGN